MDTVALTVEVVGAAESAGARALVADPVPEGADRAGGRMQAAQLQIQVVRRAGVQRLQKRLAVGAGAGGVGAAALLAHGVVLCHTDFTFL
ncbi:MAG: hypothetical protein IPK19_37935 [Chloroflexi bacterium]|nr:hypothetical protein [Chloroflexota bacterium]